MAPEILTGIFLQKESNYSPRNSTAVQGRSIKTVMYDSAKNMGDFTDGIKKIVSPTFFKEQIREWAPKNCPFHLRKTFVQNTGFL